MKTLELTNSMENRTSESELAKSPKHLIMSKKRGRVLTSVLSIILVCAVISLASILYHFVPEVFNIPLLSNNATITKCQKKVYSNRGSPCYSLLQQFQECFNTADSDEVYIVEETDTTTSDSIVGLFSLAISSYGSKLCKEDMIPFMCLYLFPICDKSGSIFYPSSQDCLDISTDVCKNEWQKVIELGEGSLLPKCSNLPTESPYRYCIDDTNDTSLPQMVVNTSEYQCPNDFFIVNGTCRPRCDRWVTNKGFTLEISAIISGSLGTVCTIFFCAIIFHQRRTMFVFPKVLIIYITGDAAVLFCITPLVLLVLTNYIDRSRLFCTSPDLITSLGNPSTFCNASGATFMFLLLHMSLLWFFHVAAMFIKLQWPLQSRKVAFGGYYKHLHVLCLLVSSTMPILPVALVLESNEFATFTFPPLFCTPTNREVTFYSIILPVSALLATGSSLLIIMLHIICQHNRNLLREKSSEGQLTFNTAERKLVVTLCYYVVLGTMTLTAFSMSARNVERYASELGTYFSCIETGASQACHQYKDKAEADTPLELAVTAYLLLGLFPAVNLLYIIRVRRILFFLQSLITKMGFVSISQPKPTLTCRGDIIVRNKIPNDCIVVVNGEA